ncbi:MAG: hypothetical protein V1922_05355 [bacterium]
MQLLSNFFTFQKLFQVGAIVLSFLSLVLTIQMYANISQVVKTVVTKRNKAFVLISALIIVISVLLFILGFVIL